MKKTQSTLPLIDLNLGHHIYSHAPNEHVKIPARSTPQKIRKRKPTINTSPMMVPTAIPTMAPGDKSGRAVGRERWIPVY